MGVQGDDNKWPPWVQPLLQTSFFGQCQHHHHHGGGHKSECNMYCLDCINGAICSLCLPFHNNHRLIQIRRSSYHDVIRVSEIQKYMDIGGVQTYIINSAKIVFLKQRPQPRPAKGAANPCLVCDRSLLDSFSFCSLGCKIIGTSIDFRTKKMGTEMVGSEYSEEESILDNGNGGLRRRRRIRSLTPSTPPQTTGNSRTAKRRKGVPHRAPMGPGFIMEYW